MAWKDLFWINEKGAKLFDEYIQILVPWKSRITNKSWITYKWTLDRKTIISKKLIEFLVSNNVPYDVESGLKVDEIHIFVRLAYSRKFHPLNQPDSKYKIIDYCRVKIDECVNHITMDMNEDSLTDPIRVTQCYSKITELETIKRYLNLNTLDQADKDLSLIAASYGIPY